MSRLRELARLMKELATGAEDSKSITYHDPCHLKKSLGVAAQHRALL
jgi:Fe-S oxidoreductase